MPALQAHMLLPKDRVSVGLEGALPLQAVFGVFPAGAVGLDVGQRGALKGPLHGDALCSALGGGVHAGANLLQGLTGVFKGLGQGRGGIAT